MTARRRRGWRDTAIFLLGLATFVYLVIVVKDPSWTLVGATLVMMGLPAFLPPPRDHPRKSATPKPGSDDDQPPGVAALLGELVRAYIERFQAIPPQPIGT